MASKFQLHVVDVSLTRQEACRYCADTEGEGKFKCCQVLQFSFLFRAAFVALFYFSPVISREHSGEHFHAVEKKIESYCEVLQSKLTGRNCWRDTQKVTEES